MKKYICNGYGKNILFNNLKKPFEIRKMVSIIIPSFNEEENIERLVNEIKKYMKKTKFNNGYEIIVVDDNSFDKTGKIIDELSKNEGFIALHRYGVRGLFTAVHDGIFVANGKYIMTLDADFSHPPKLIPEFMEKIEKYDIVYGSRYIKGGGIKGVGLFRKIGSIILNKLCIFIAGLSVSDFGGQFRIFNKDKYSKIRYKNNSSFAEYGIELFYRVKKLKFRVKAIPFVYEFREKGDSKMGDLKKLPLLGMKYLKVAFRLRMESIFK